MDDRDEFETTLREARLDVDPRTRGSVLRAYRGLHAGASPLRLVPFWRRPIPLYLAVCLAVVVAGLSLALGTRAATHRLAVSGTDSSLVGVEASLPDLTWATVERDQL